MLQHIKISIVGLILICFTIACNQTKEKKEDASQTTTEKDTLQINYAVVSYFPHDINSFTEGFLFNNQELFESTGSPQELPNSESVFGPVDLKTGKIDVKATLDRKTYFGEGIVFMNDKIYQLTYQNQKGFIYDAKTFKKTGEFNFINKEGWGLTSDGTNIIMSDGSDSLTYVDPNGFKPLKSIKVTLNGSPQQRLNELEFIKGYIYANIWMTNYIVKINPSDGKIVGRLDLTDLAYEAKNKNNASAEMNGIAYDSSTDKILVTGKLWPNIYQINFSH